MKFKNENEIKKIIKGIKDSRDHGTSKVANLRYCFYVDFDRELDKQEWGSTFRNKKTGKDTKNIIAYYNTDEKAPEGSRYDYITTRNYIFIDDIKMYQRKTKLNGKKPSSKKQDFKWTPVIGDTYEVKWRNGIIGEILITGKTPTRFKFVGEFNDSMFISQFKATEGQIFYNCVNGWGIYSGHGAKLIQK